MRTTEGDFWRTTIYGVLHDAARRVLRGRRSDPFLQPTSLLHEVYLRLQRKPGPPWSNCEQFVAAAVGEMRRALIDQVRADNAEKRGGAFNALAIDLDQIATDAPDHSLADVSDALKRLNELSGRQARVAELRLLAGLSEVEIAESLSISPRTVQKDWRAARAWLRRALNGGWPNSTRDAL